MIKITIDPGSTSGVVCIHATGLTSTWTFLPFKTVDYYEIDRYLSNAKQASLRNAEELKCIIEKVHAFPGQGISSTAKFMENFGTIKGLLIANKISFKEKTPQTWMKTLPIKKAPGEQKDVWKKRLVQLARQELPDVKFVNAYADAILMNLYFDKIF